MLSRARAEYQDLHAQIAIRTTLAPAPAPALPLPLPLPLPL